MKKFFILICCVYLTLTVNAQTFIYEDFSSSQMPPAGWTIDQLTNQWSINNGNEAGGTAPEGKFTYTSGNYTTRLISPAADLTGLTTVKLQFSHFYDDFSGTGPALGVATRSQGGQWNSVWEITPPANVGPEELTLEISNGDVGQPDFQFCFYLTGNMYNIDYWYVDDIWLFLQLNLDGALTMITTPPYVAGATEVMGIVKNQGSDQITSLDIDWQADGGDIHSSGFTGLALDFGETYEFTCGDMFNFPIGIYDLKVWIVNVNGVPDQDPSNDEKVKSISVVSHVIQHRPCFEEFTSSTCAPCATFNAQFVPWCQQNADDLTLIKYQMNWPGGGDPYYTAECGVRKDYYGVGWVPYTILDGSYAGNSMGPIITSYETALELPGLMDIACSHTLSGTVMDVECAVLPYADFPGMKVYIIVFEYITTQNVGTNGETEFHHVMMKMVPDANGTSADLSDRAPFTITESVDLVNTNVEEFSDLGVIVFVQEHTSRQIFQSEYSVENGNFADEARLSNLYLDGIGIPGFDPDVNVYNIELPPGTVEIPVAEGTPMDPNATVIIEPTFTLPGTTMIDVFAEDLTTHQLYEVNFTLLPPGINTFPYTESYEGGLAAWQQSQDDDFDWTLNQGPTPSSGTGPQSAYDGSYYLFTEASDPNNPNKTAGVYATFNFTQVDHPVIHFWYHMYGSNMGSLTLQASANVGTTWTNLWSLSGNQGDQWHGAEIDLLAYANTAPVMLRFRGVTGDGYRSDMAIDYVEVFEGVPPSCITPVYPPNEAFGVPVGASLSWNAAPDAQGYRIWFGTDNPPTTIENGTDLGNVLSYTPVAALSYNTDYYWKIKPYNQYGEPQSCPTWQFTTEEAGLEVNLKIFLEGPYTGPYMSTVLNLTGLTPLTQPYNMYPWWYQGAEAVQEIPSNDVVEWVLVELRDAPDAASATASTMIARKAAFLMKDGMIRDLDGVSLLPFNVLVNDNLFAVVWHRNHLGVMSAVPLTSSQGVYNYDFTNAGTKAHGGSIAHKQLSPGVWGMTGGDGNPDGQIGNSDKLDVWNPQSGNSGYLSGDFNMDGQVNNADKVDIWAPNSGNGCQVP